MSFEYEQRQKKPGGTQALSSGHGLGQLPNLGQSPSGGDTARRSVRIVDSTVRKYLLLLHDCLAIKFVPLHPPLTRFNGDAGRNGRGNYENGDHQPFGTSSARSSGFGPPPSQRPARPPSAASNITMTHFPGGLADSGAPEVDHSLHGLYLYKGFRDANLQCHWNSALYEAFRNLEYKGYIVPSTVLIWAIPRFLTTLRTAWARQMLRSPPGYRIEFMGEIEELIADPVQQSQFAPLSDSLCWAILEITSLGQEAFVDSILAALSAAFPTMVEPSRELVYQTLEKLIKERKVYQTSHGYFVVTPDTFRYMSSSNNGHHYSVQQQPFDSPTFSSNTLTLDALITNPTLPQTANNDSEDKLSFSRNSWDSTASAENPIRETEFGSELKPNSEPPLRRHNSLKVIRQKDKENTQSASKTLGRRTLSFRLYKSKSTPNTGVGGKDKSSSREDDTEFPTTGAEPKVKSGKSFFRKLFKRSSSKSKKATTSVERATTPSPSPTPKASASTSTQTPPCNPSEPERITLTRPGPEPDNCSTTGVQCNLSQLGYSTDLLSSRWDGLHKQEQRPASRLMEDDGPLYATPGNVTISPDPGPASGPSRPNSMFNFQRGESSRCSTLSHGTSLGYGSQGPASLGFHSQSPTPSMSLSGAYPASKPNSQPVPNLLPRNSSNYNSYRSYYDFYRRRYPSYGSSMGSTLQTRPPTPLLSPTKPSSHCYETIGYPRQKTIPDPKPLSAEPKTELKSKNVPNCSTTTNKCDPFTTTVTQNVKSTTNMELEFRLPLGKLVKGNGGNSNFTIRKSEPTTKVSVNVGGEPNRVPNNKSPNNGTNTITTISVDQQEECQPKTEVKTTVNHNGRIETSFDCSDESNKSSNSVQIRINSKTGDRRQMSNGGSNEPKAYRKISDIGLYRNNNHAAYPPVRVTDICKDSDEEIL